MTLGEVLLLLQHHQDDQPGNYPGKLTRRTVRELQDWMARGYPQEG
jgi:hypothetical protein